MAGGDGSLAVVAAVAAAGGIPFVCILWGSIAGSCLGGRPGWDHR
jgi:hypothetical protein